MTVIERIEELIQHYRKAGLIGEVIGLRVALEILRKERGMTNADSD